VSTVTVSGLAITPSTDLLKINQSEAFALTATMSDGSTRSVTGTWRSESPAVATVDSNGRVTGVASGDTAIVAESNGVQATPRPIRVVPDYQGYWYGDWQFTACAADGDWTRSEICREVPVGLPLGLELALTQERDNTTGTLTLDDLTVPVQGPIRPGGQLTLSGAFTEAVEGIVVEITVADWESATTDNQRMTGRFAISFRAAGLRGSVRLNGELGIVAKSALLSTTHGQPRLRQLLSVVTRRP
jgi:hypothetical protein